MNFGHFSGCLVHIEKSIKASLLNYSLISGMAAGITSPRYVGDTELLLLSNIRQIFISYLQFALFTDVPLKHKISLHGRISDQSH